MDIMERLRRGSGVPIAAVLLLTTVLFLFVGWGGNFEAMLSEGGITISRWLIYIGVLLMAVFFVVSIIMDPKGSVKTLVGLGVFLLLLFLVYTMSSGELTGVFKTSKYSFVTPDLMKKVAAGINSALVLIVIAAVAAVVSEIANLFR